MSLAAEVYEQSSGGVAGGVASGGGEGGTVEVGVEAEDEGHMTSGEPWNLSNPDTNGVEESVLISEVSSFQRLKNMQEWYTYVCVYLGVRKGSRGVLSSG